MPVTARGGSRSSLRLSKAEAKDTPFRKRGVSKDYVLYSDRSSVAALYVPTVLAEQCPVKVKSPGTLEPQQNSPCQGPHYASNVVGWVPLLQRGELKLNLRPVDGEMSADDGTDCSPSCLYCSKTVDTIEALEIMTN